MANMYVFNYFNKWIFMIIRHIFPPYVFHNYIYYNYSFNDPPLGLLSSVYVLRLQPKMDCTDSRGLRDRGQSSSLPSFTIPIP